VNEFFSKDKDFLALFVHGPGSAPGELSVVSKSISPELKALGDEGGDKSLAAIQGQKELALANVARGEVVVVSLKLTDSAPAVALSVPLIASATVEGEFTHVATALIRQTRFVKAFSESEIVTSFMIDRKGRLLAHPDAARVATGENVSSLPVVKQLLEGKFNNGQTRYADPQSGERRLGAFRVVGFGGLGVVAEVAEAKAFEAAKRVQYRSMLVAGIILSISFLAGYLFSGTITWPIKLLMEAAGKISEGDFNINLVPKGQDELAHLSTAFNEMAKGLEERDRVKETFNKFHNKEIAEKLLSGEVKLGGERKIATIFFSDVRGFTAMSESMEPEQVVEMLNEYMTRMVSIIRTHGGVVDKYVGDAIMALWGVPIAGTDDTYRAVRACLAMREDLAKLNELRISRGQNPLKIGMGLNTGQVIAGNIGSDEKMEYTVIGDSVNLASRIESMTKEYGTDFLISKGVYEEVKDRFVTEACRSAKVKGKSTAIEIFRVLGYIAENGEPVLIETPYSSYASEKSDKAVHDDPPPVEYSDSTKLILDTRTDLVAEAAPAFPAQNPNQQWYFYVEEQVFGPFSTAEIENGLATAQITLNMPCNDKPEGPWLELGERPEFQGFAKAQKEAA
jgi:adenylate cyclase